MAPTSTRCSGSWAAASSSSEWSLDAAACSGDNTVMKPLGTLEADVMDVLWNTAPEPQSVHDILAALSGLSGREHAYTTILTVVTNLHSKGFLERTKVSRAYHYSPVQTRQEATSQALRDILASSEDPAAVLMHFAQTVSPEEQEALRKSLSKRSRRTR